MRRRMRGGWKRKGFKEEGGAEVEMKKLMSGILGGKAEMK